MSSSKDAETTRPSSESDPEIHELHDAVLRETPDPVDGNEPAPLWMWLTAALVIAYTGYYLGAFSGDFNPSRMDLAPVAVSATETTGPPTYEDRDPLELGEQRFKLCVSCHQSNGAGLPGRYPPLASSDWVAKDPAVVVRILLHGMTGPIDVNGARYSGSMPRWGMLTDAEIAGVLTYVRSSFGNSAEPIDFNTVAAIREETAGRSAAWTQADLLAVEADAKSADE